MKTNRLTARVLAVFAAVLLITAISIPAFAATSYTFTEIEAGSRFYPVSIPEGKYRVTFSVPDGDSVGTLSLPEPIYISYGPLELDDFSFDQGYLYSGSFEFEGFSLELLILVAVYTDDGLDKTVFACSLDGVDVLAEGATVTLELVPESVSLTDYIDVDTLPNVFNEIVALLPIALGVLIGYIAIRKGISYLQSFLHNS